MPKVIVLFGPPATGKSFTFGREVKAKYNNYQAINVDKDILNKNFFHLPLIKTNHNSPFDIIWRTTSHLIELLSSEFTDLLQQKNTSDEKELVLFLQGVTIGGVQKDIEVLLKAGYTMEFVLVTVESSQILFRRIHNRKIQGNAAGAPPMSLEELEYYYKSCNQTFFNIIRALSEETQAQNVFGAPEETQVSSDEYSLFKEYKSCITYRVELTSTTAKGEKVYPEDTIEFESNLVRDVFLPEEIQIKDDHILLNKKKNDIDTFSHMLPTG
ncbi:MULTISPECIES: hypothetical protein [unclassified Paenibacillus]|uniref:hypothetical protein n=1 Tax=unclassified Paenibacillus TaxID=185978 RepID=UPI0024071448|nr:MULTISPECIES: hypothetical protein [unclassified Paenibacillus]MDF9845407.1 hypothetical protein [Paenibacillus sp. PastF-2]MDF9851991.1 hypothetical protein [Paenibacillus sp. PastM-2]MDF9858524.1 hypothetical protein [Paenibacillus sp. PastF-1]MDH6483790.1 hypothetical protein [Paenibacillus sp. PastH-2]MDH6511187.1 hypothetical protein [Paenibacillus sp. PastM-3]